MCRPGGKGFQPLGRGPVGGSPSVRENISTNGPNGPVPGGSSPMLLRRDSRDALIDFAPKNTMYGVLERYGRTKKLEFEPPRSTGRKTHGNLYDVPISSPRSP